MKRKKDWSRDPLPVGTVRIRSKSRTGYRCRVIKVRMDGPRGRRWMHYARWWWLKNKGPIPPGMRVAHRDGNTLNDEPSNYVLCSAADVAFLCHTNDPKMSEENYRKLRQATREHNQLRARVRRMTSWLPTRWYPVLTTTGQIFNRPVRCRWQVYGAVGVDVRVERNGDGADQAALGWPDLPLLCALVLAALSEHDGFVEAGTLRSRVDAMRVERGYPALACNTTIYQATSPLSRDGLISVSKRGRAPAVYRITGKAVSMRGPWTAAVPVRGVDLSGERFAGYTRVDDELGQAGKPVNLLGSLRLLAQAMGGSAA